MKISTLGGAAARLFTSLLPAAALCFALDMAVTLLWQPVRSGFFFLALAVVTLLFFFSRLSVKRRLAVFFIIVLVCALLLAAAGLIWYRFNKSAAYRDVDSGKAALYAGRNVMVIVPHQDDDLNILGGVFEEYEKYGSRVSVVFVTNGDYYDRGMDRMREALDVLTRSGVEEDDVIFLGYGDTWAGDRHIYNAPENELMTSFIGYTSTYGLPDHPAYREGEKYTRKNLMSDMRGVILERRPDVIFCIDLDYHADHQAVSLAFEEAMGDVLKACPDYAPDVFKGMAYSTAWYAADDFYTVNIRSTTAPYPAPYLYERQDYKWDARVRFPVCASTLSRSLLGSRQFAALRLYRSQAAWVQAPYVINGDKVFWFRPTGSLSYMAKVSVSSGNAALLNDFKLLDSTDLNSKRLPYDGTWVTEPGDEERSAEFLFPEAVTLSVIRLYDDSDAFSNVLNAEIVFDDGSRVETGALEYLGAPTDISFEPRSVSSFTVRILESEGKHAGVSEIEAYSEPPRVPVRYIKLMNGEGDFVYDYRIDRSGREEFDLYSPGADAESCTVSCEGEGCSAELRGGRVSVSCPRGRSCTVSVSADGGELSDTVYISNPSPLRDLGQRIEAFAWHNYSKFQKSELYLFMRSVYHIFTSENIVL